MPKPTIGIEQKYKKYATPAQIKYIDAVNEHGSMRSAARALACNSGTILEAVTRAKKNHDTREACKKTDEQEHGLSPEHDWNHAVPPTHVAARVSSHYTKGELDRQWVIATIDERKRASAQLAAFQALAETLEPLDPALGPRISDLLKDLCNVYTLTDSHVGALCWHREGGDDWDLKIAERTLVGCFEKMLQASPDAHTCVVAQLGDFLHADGMLPLTPAAKNVLDVDGRFDKVVQVAVRVLRRVVSMALAKHQKVIVLMAEGNHDPVSSIWLRVMFGALFENEPRIEVIDSPLPYYVYQHGSVMLGWHHGHLKEKGGLPLFFAARFAQMWGATLFRYIHTGHMHHVDVKEHSGCTVTQHSTITAADAHSARHAYVNDRQVTAVSYHRDFGVHSTVTITPAMLEPSA